MYNCTVYQLKRLWFTLVSRAGELGGLIVGRVTLEEVSMFAFRLTVYFHWLFIGLKCAA
jgi:hypothetical protein